MSDADAQVTPAEERLVTSFMRRLQSTPVGAPMQTPTADVLWLKAQLVRRWEAQRQVRRPLDVMEAFEMVASLAAAVLLLAWSIPSAFASVARLIF